MGLTNPYQFPADPPPPHKPNIFHPSFSSGFDLACWVDGYDLPCGEAFRSAAAGAARITPLSIYSAIVGSVRAYEPQEVEEPYSPSDVPENPDDDTNPVTVKPPRTRIEWIPTGLIRTSIQPRQLQNPVTEGIDQARQALQENSLCRAFFGRDPLKLLNTYSSNNLITSGSSYQVAQRGGTRSKRFTSGDVGAVTSTGAGSYSTPAAPGVTVSANPITINKDGFFFSGRDTHGIAVNTIRDRGFYGLSIGQVRGAVIVHELLHVVGRLPSDGDNPRMSQRNSEFVRRFCFPNNFLSTTTNFARRL